VTAAVAAVAAACGARPGQGAPRFSPHRPEHRVVGPDRAITQHLGGYPTVRTVAVDVTDEDAVLHAFAGMAAPDHESMSAADFVGGSVPGTDMLPA
jgi:hypothetical protein